MEVRPLLQYVCVAAILDVAALPRELVQVSGVNFLKLLLQSARSLHIHTHANIFRKQIDTKNNVWYILWWL